MRPVWFETESGELLCLLFLLDAMMGLSFVGGKYCGAGALQHNYEGPFKTKSQTYSVNQVTEVHIVRVTCQSRLRLLSSETFG